MVWLTPEYNHSFTSAAKNAFDFLHAELRRKPMAVCGLTGGNLGGVRAVGQIRLVLMEMHAAPTCNSVFGSDARTIFDDRGVLKRQEHLGRVDDMLTELAWIARVLTWGRAEVPLPVQSR